MNEQSLATPNESLLPVISISQCPITPIAIAVASFSAGNTLSGPIFLK